MAFLDFLGKKKKMELPLPPPPLPPRFQGDMAPIRPAADAALPAPVLPPLEIPFMHEYKMSEPEENMDEHMDEMPMQMPKPQRMNFEEQEELHPEMQRVVPPESFISLNDFRRIVSDTNTIRAKLMEGENYLKRLTTLKHEEDRALVVWRAHVEDAEKKLSYIDRLIEKARR